MGVPNKLLPTHLQKMMFRFALVAMTLCMTAHGANNFHCQECHGTRLNPITGVVCSICRALGVFGSASSDSSDMSLVDFEGQGNRPSSPEVASSSSESEMPVDRRRRLPAQQLAQRLPTSTTAPEELV